MTGTHTDPRVRRLIEGLLDETPEAPCVEEFCAPFDSARLALRALMNIRAPGPLPAEWLALQDELLREENAARALVPETEGRLSVWRGDITRLEVDGIVNAANPAMLGCFAPLHYCIDNAIHSAAGLQLRNECDAIMRGDALATGDARVTKAWNLPSRFVIHTVGPIVRGELTAGHEALLARAYRSVLTAAAANGMRSLALCCVSTGVFGFPAERAAEIAVGETRAFAESTPPARAHRLLRVPRIRRGPLQGAPLMTASDLSRAEDPSEKALALVDALDKADRVLVGAGSGLSASAGLTYSGPRFESAFPDFIDAFGLTDMYSAGFHPFPSPETKWAYWSRHVLLNRYEPGPLPAYRELLSLLEGSDFFVLTTNVDHQFPLAGFPEERLFATQGDYGRFQCSIPCRPETWGNESAIRSMTADQSGLAVPASSIPRCPWCGAEAMMHLRVDSRFVEDAPWHEAAARYRDFSARTGRTVYLELGVGMNTPGIIKYPFWQAVHTSPDAVFATLDSHPLVPAGIAERSIALPGDIATSIHELTRARQSA